jgi:general secretion pathway protein C
MLEFSLKKIRYLNYLIIIFIVIAALLTIREIISLSLTKKEHHSIAANKNLNKAEFQRKNIMYYSSILEKNPFGQPMELKPIAISQKTVAKYTSPSTLALLGTVVGPRHLSYAVFEDRSQSGTGKQEIFTYGEEVFNYGILTKIEKSSVELRNNSFTYTLSISYKDSETSPKIRQIQKTASSKKRFAKKVGDREYILDSRKVQQSLENPEHILTDARLLPHFVNGRQEGFKISEVVPDGLYHSLGLRNGDILLRVNGLELSNPEVAIQAMTALRGMNRVELDIIRNGENISMSYQIR